MAHPLSEAFVFQHESGRIRALHGAILRVMSEVGRLVHQIDASDSPRELRIAALAARQHGVVARHQLFDLGLGRGAIDRRLASGRLHPIHRAVYAVGHPRLIGRGRWMAAVLACGPAALLSHGTAAALWGIAPTASARVHVTTAKRSRAGQLGIALHRVRGLDEHDRGERDGIPVTTVPRTLLDLAEVLHPRQLERAFEEAERLELVDLRAISHLLERSRGRRGLKLLIPLLAQCTTPPPETRSELERRFLDLCRNAGLPAPAVNVVVAGFEVDACWPRHRLIIELDSWAYHRHRSSFESDRARDTALQLAGYRVLRVTHRRLQTEPDRIVETVRSLLARP